MRIGLFYLVSVMLFVVTVHAQSPINNKQKLLVDNTPPVAVCDGSEQISLTSIPTKVMAFTFDDGSNDETCLSHFLVKRMGEPDMAFKSFIEFDCNDVSTSPIKVVLRVVDCSGNYNDCWSNAYIEDKTKPVIFCAPDVTINCGDDPAKYWGTPNAFDNCGNVTLTSSIIDATDQCLSGYISKIWTAKDQFKNQATCTQQIYLKHISDYSVTFPNDVTITKCSSPDDLTNTGTPVFSNKDCELVAVGYTDHDLPITDGNGCFVRIRKWQLISWCNYDPNKATHTPLGIPQGGKKYKDDDGYFEYSQYIKVFENTDPKLTCKDSVVCITDNTCIANFTIHKPKVVDCSSNINYQLSGDLGASFNAVDVSPGVYTVKHNISDGCGNHSFCDVKITVKDCKKPTPVVIKGLSTTIMVQNGLATVWASDFNQSSYDNCTPSSKLKFSFSKDINNSFAVFNCDNIGVRTLKIWVTDEAGNSDYAVTTIDIQDNMNACDTTGSKIQISGNITSPDGSPYSNVDLINPYVNLQTDTAGVFNSPLLNLNLPYSIKLVKDVVPSTGLSVLDVILLKDHILGIKKLSTPFQYLAADVNKSNSLNTVDLFQIKQIILGTYDKWPSNVSLNYVDKNNSYSIPQEIWSKSFTEIKIDSVAVDSVKFNIYAIKTGDISQLANVVENETITRTQNTLNLINGNQIGFKGDAPVKGMQFSLILNGFPENIASESGLVHLVQLDNKAWELRFITDEIVYPGQVLISWNNIIDLNAVSLSKSYKSFAVDELNQIIGLELVSKDLDEVNRENEMLLYPNPAKNVFYLNVLTEFEELATIDILAIDGKMVERIDRNLSKGLNSLSIPVKLPSGIYTIKVKTDTKNYQKKISITN